MLSATDFEYEREGGLQPAKTASVPVGSWLLFLDTLKKTDPII